jgi:hypothetical protein
MNVPQMLQHGFEITKGEKMTTDACKARIPLAAAAITSKAKENLSLVKSGELVVVSQTVPADFDFTFNSVHCTIPLQKEVEIAPLVIEIVYQEGNSDRFYVRIKIDLVYYDGVTGLHTAFQVLEFIEHGDLSKVLKYERVLNQVFPVYCYALHCVTSAVSLSVDFLALDHSV